MLNLAELKAQLKELDDEIVQTEQKLQELYDLRSSLGGDKRQVSRPGLQPPSADEDQPIVPTRDTWTPEQQAIFAAEERRIREMQRLNQNMPLPRAVVKRQEVKIPPNVDPKAVLPSEMVKFLSE